MAHSSLMLLADSDISCQFQTSQHCVRCCAHSPCRDHGPRGDRQKTRLIWLIEQLGFEAFANLVAETMGPGTQLAPAVHVAHDEPWERRDLLGVHAQKQPGLNWVGVSVPSGRLQAEDMEVRCFVFFGTCFGYRKRARVKSAPCRQVQARYECELLRPRTCHAWVGVCYVSHGCVFTLCGVDV
jgi:hypothetical protein